MVIITTNQELIELCHFLSKAKLLAIDTEFLRDKTYYPQLCLIQIATGPDSGYIIDPLAQDLDLAPLMQLLLNEEITKIFHSGRQDIEIIYNLTGAIPSPIFDTQVAAMVCGFGESISYEKLVKQLLDKKINKLARISDWSLRPLTQEQLDYALSDVLYLHEIYHKLTERLIQTNRTHWLQEKLESLMSVENYRNNPENAWLKLNLVDKSPQQLYLLKQLAAWRETHAQALDVPRNHLLKTEALVELTNSHPLTLKSIARMRILSEHIIKNKLEDSLLTVLQDSQDKTLTDSEILPTPINYNNSEIILLLKLLLKFVSKKNNVAEKLIASKTDLENIAINKLDQLQCFTDWRYELFGQYVEKLMQGKLAVTMRDNEVEMVELP